MTLVSVLAFLLVLLSAAYGQTAPPYPDANSWPSYSQTVSRLRSGNSFPGSMDRGGNAASEVSAASSLSSLLQTNGALMYSDQEPPYTTFPIPTSSTKDPAFSHETFAKVINNQLVHGHIFTIGNPLNWVNFNQPLNGCPGMIRTSVSAESANCRAAMNAGFFDIHRGTCLGNLVSNGQVVHNRGVGNANFAMTKNGTYVVGYLDKSDIDNNFAFKELISGIGWLVRNGSYYVDKSFDIEGISFEFFWIKAPRTAIGHDIQGRLIMVEVDGDEYLNKGLDLQEWANLVQSFGLVNAVNMDGGGSAAVWKDGRTINKYSDYCPAPPIPGARCERQVTTYFCVRNRV